MPAGKAIVQHFTGAHSGPGWYFFDDDYSYEGSCGPFATAEDAETAAFRVDYAEVEIVEDAHE